jgi:hypothetical protein
MGIKYRITRLRARAILAELGLEISTGRPQISIQMKSPVNGDL